MIGKVLKLILNPQGMDNLFQQLPVCPPAVQLKWQHHVFIHIQDRNKIIVLKDKTDMAAECGQFFLILIRNLFSANQHLSGRRCVQPAHHVEQRGFSGTGSSHDSNKLSLFDGKAHAIQGFCHTVTLPVVFFQINCL